jgi:AcrR family transcriptional regulator
MSERNDSMRHTGRLVLPPLRFADPSVGEQQRERRDAAANREQVLAAARSLFATKGVDAVTMEEIAAAAGVGKGTLYRRYSHKGALCLALLGDNALRLADEMRRAVEQPGAQHAALPLLDAFLARLVAFNEDNGELLSAAGDAAPGMQRGWLYTTPIYQWMRATLQALLGHAIARGEIRQLNLEIAADVLLAPFAIDLYQHQRHKRGLSSADILTTTVDLLRNGLAGQSGAMARAPRRGASHYQGE